MLIASQKVASFITIILYHEAAVKQDHLKTYSSNDALKGASIVL
jgi:hypothetical protein